MTARARAGSYLLEVEHPRTGATIFEDHTSLAAVIARAAEFIHRGYNIGIWSAASLEHRSGSAAAANDDAWIDTLMETG